MPREMILRQQVYEQLKQDIITCKINPGAPLSESELSERLKVSKTPVREALTSLVQDGLVEYLPNRGFTVTNISIKDIQEIFEARAILEKALIRLIIKHITDGEIVELQKLSGINPKENTPEAVEEYLDANQQFHLKLASIGRNDRLYSYYANLLNQYQRLFYMDFAGHGGTSSWAHGHDEIIAALKARDEQAGITAIEKTLESARQRILGS